jgi:DNA-binding XRE family transcriptional regulator
MTILRRRKDPRTPAERKADEEMLARIEQGAALSVSPDALEAAANRIRERNAERRREVARLGEELAELRRAYGLTQDEIARSIGTSKPNISALERGRAPGISLERFMAVIEAIRERAAAAAAGSPEVASGDATFSPTARISSLEECVAVE